MHTRMCRMRTTGMSTSGAAVHGSRPGMDWFKS